MAMNMRTAPPAIAAHSVPLGERRRKEDEILGSSAFLAVFLLESDILWGEEGHLYIVNDCSGLYRKNIPQIESEANHDGAGR
jgi:hypothetical protein